VSVIIRGGGKWGGGKTDFQASQVKTGKFTGGQDVSRGGTGQIATQGASQVVNVK